MGDLFTDLKETPNDLNLAINRIAASLKAFNEAIDKQKATERILHLASLADIKARVELDEVRKAYERSTEEAEDILHKKMRAP